MVKLRTAGNNFAALEVSTCRPMHSYFGLGSVFKQIAWDYESIFRMTILGGNIEPKSESIKSKAKPNDDFTIFESTFE